MREISREEYVASFVKSSGFPDKAKEIHKKAYEIANENRKFEIENYWKRANYYWLFQASVYAGYFYSVTAGNNEFLCKNPEIIVGITCLGFLTALAWFLSNIGSKQWQSNWENHVDELEDGITGPLYKIVGNDGTWSVSRINEFVSLFSVLAWVLLGFKTIHIFFDCPLAFVAYLLAIALIASVFYFFGKGLVKHEEYRWFRRGGKNV